MPDSNVAPAYHDDNHLAFIRERLPERLSKLKPEQARHLRYLKDSPGQAWLLNANPALREAFEQAQTAAHVANAALADALRGLKHPAELAEPLLRQRLHDVFGFQGDLRTMNLVRFSHDWTWPVLERYLSHRVEPVLAAALQNFSPDEDWLPESVLAQGDFQVTQDEGFARYHYSAVPITAAQFARECHALDLGGRYQQHLTSLFTPAQTRRLGIEARKANFRLDLLTAQLRYHLRDDCKELRALSEESAPTAGAGAQCRQLSLFGIDIQDAVVIQPRQDSVAIALYLPGLDGPSLTRYPTPGACQRDLLHRLCEPKMRQQFVDFIRQDQRQHFVSVLQRNLTGDTRTEDRDGQWTLQAGAQLHWNEEPIDQELFGYLQDRHQQRVLAEAKLMAVPSADVDEAARQARIHYWESLGLDVLGIAAFFIPAAGQLMAAVFVLQLLDEAYEGVQAWRVGDIDAALGHVKAITSDAASAVGSAVALHYASKFGGKLIEVLRADLTPRLWNGDLTPWQASLPEHAVRNEAGQWVADSRHYLSIDGAHYEHVPHADGQRWSLAHPAGKTGGHRPTFEHNGQGAWLGSHETPRLWSRRTLLRRIGHLVEGYSDEELEVASRISGIHRDELLDIYLKRQPSPPRLLDTLQRLRGDALAESPLERLCEGLYRPSRSSPSSERLVLTSLVDEPRWPSAASLELRGGSLEGPTLEKVGARSTSDARLIVKVPGGYRALTRRGLMPAREDLFDALAEAVPEFAEDRQALKGRIADRAHANPERTLSRIWPGASNGWSRTGRLSGGSDRPFTYPPASQPPHSLMGRYRQLYPTATDEHALAQLQVWSRAGRAPHLVLRGLEQQLEYLRTLLGQWVGNIPTRLAVQDALLQSWRRMQPRPGVLNLSGLQLGDADFERFPHLAGEFDHVQELVLNSNPLRSLPLALTRNFPNLRCLCANALQLEQVPLGLGSQLNVLELNDNRIVWNAASQAALEQYPNLEFLNLSGNPLGTAPDVSQLAELSELSLFDTAIQQIPAGIGALEDLQAVDLSANLITEVPEPSTFNEPTQRALSLEHNPLSPQSVERIEAHYASTGIDLAVSEDDYSPLLFGANAQTQASWARLSRLLPLQYRRDLRLLSESATNLSAPTTTRRRIAYLLRWLDASPLGRQHATSCPASDLLQFEMAAELEQTLQYPDARSQTEHILAVAIAGIRYRAVSDALDARFPESTALQHETLRALTLQHVAVDPHLPLRIAPTPAEPVESARAGELLAHLDGEWLDTLRDQLLDLAPTTANGRDALLAETPDGLPVLPYWSERLRLRYADDFEHLQEQANEQLSAAEQQMNEGDYLVEAQRLRQAFERDQRQLLEDLTRTIADGTQTRW